MAQQNTSPQESMKPPSNAIEQYFDSIKRGQNDQVRTFLTNYRSLTQEKRKCTEFKYDPDVELDAYKFLGAYLGSMTGLHLAILLGHDSIAKDIIDASFPEDLELTYGGGNSALHLAMLLGAKDVVKLLLERGVNRNSKNGKGFTPLDVVDDQEMIQWVNTIQHQKFASEPSINLQ